MKVIKFPEGEVELIKDRLKDTKSVTTTRIGDELGVFKINDEYLTEWGDVVQIVGVARFYSIEQHPYYEYLSKSQISRLREKPFDVVWLSSRATEFLKLASYYILNRG